MYRAERWVRVWSSAVLLLAGLALAWAAAVMLGGRGESSDEAASGRAVDSPIHVDQFGYRPGDPKWAVLSDPEFGANRSDEYAPGRALEVRRVDDDSVALSAVPEIWNAGAVHDQSGDRGWWLDISDLREPGTYYVLDPTAEVSSPSFVVADDVYERVLDTAVKVFWFNRGNVVHEERFGGPWHDEAAFVGPGQDSQARWVDAPDDPKTERDLSGGWFDAGDTNKYVTFAGQPVHVLLSAYERSPDVFGDDVGIPESGNGVADVIDEVVWELDWLEKMQNGDGGVLSKVGVTEFEPFRTPSTSELPRFYEEACSSSTIVAAGVFAHAALVLKSLPGASDHAERLAGRAVDAWSWYRSNPRRDDCDPQIVLAGDADLSLAAQDRQEVVAAVYLFALTGDDAYDAVVRDGYSLTTPFTGDGFGHYDLDQADALLTYRQLAGADSEVADHIAERVSGLLADSPLFGDHDDDLYRAYLPDYAYHWGSNMVKANAGTANVLVAGRSDGRDRALAHLHYFHGVNPLGLCYLSTMEGLGAEWSVQHLFHYWFGDGSPYDVSEGSKVGPPPGYVVGGPNNAYSGTDSPPVGQPPQKSYRDWSAGGSQPTWETTEPAIYYQAAYVRLLAEVIGGG